MTTGTTPRRIQSVDRALEILHEIGDRGRCSVSEIAEAIGLSPGTVHTHLTTLKLNGFVQQEGSVSDEEMHRTFNMGTGFVAALPGDDAESVVADSEDARVIGRVEEGDGTVAIRGLEL